MMYDKLSTLTMADVIFVTSLLSKNREEIIVKFDSVKKLIEIFAVGIRNIKFDSVENLQVSWKRLTWSMSESTCTEAHHLITTYFHTLTMKCCDVIIVANSQFLLYYDVYGYYIPIVVADSNTELFKSCLIVGFSYVKAALATHPAFMLVVCNYLSLLGHFIYCDIVNVTICII